MEYKFDKEKFKESFNAKDNETKMDSKVIVT